MDGHRFDSLARKLGARGDRRAILRGVVAGGAAVVVARTGSAFAEPMDKVSICHLDKDTGTYALISVSGNAHDAHMAHGDFMPYDCDGDGVLSCEECGTEYPLFNCGPGYACPTGATTFTWDGPLDPTSPDQAKAACEACYGVECYLEDADCAGDAYGRNPTGQYVSGEAYFGYEEGCSGGPGRVWEMSSSYTTFGYWGLEECPAQMSMAEAPDGEQSSTIRP